MFVLAFNASHIFEYILWLSILIYLIIHKFDKTLFCLACLLAFLRF